MIEYVYEAVICSYKSRKLIVMGLIETIIM